MYEQRILQKGATSVAPVNRRWTLVGMALGTLLGIVSDRLPEPIRSLILWVGFSAAFGLVGTLAVFVKFRGFHFLHSTPTKVWWVLIGMGTLGGGCTGFIMWIRGAKLPEDAVAGLVIIGLLAGYSISELWLRMNDEDRRRLGRHSR